MPKILTIPVSFTKDVINTLTPLLPDATISVREVSKCGEKRLTGLVISSEGTNIAPVLYLDSFYEQYEAGEMSVSAIAGVIRDTYEKNRITSPFDTSLIRSWKKAKERVCARLISPLLNSEYLKGKVTRPVPGTSIAFMYYIPLKEGAANATSPVTEDIFTGWGITADVLHETAMANTERILAPSVTRLGDTLSEMTGRPAAGDNGILVITSKDRPFGAISACFQSVQERITDALGSPYYLIPSSVHEMLAVPSQIVSDPRDILSMVCEVNRTQVTEDERLADDVYVIRDGALASAFRAGQREHLVITALEAAGIPC